MFKKASKIITFMLLLGVLASCAPGDKQEENQGEGRETSHVDMDGYEAKISIIETDVGKDSVFCYKLDTPLADYALNRFKEIEENYNNKISFHINADAAKVAADILAGTLESDIFYEQDQGIFHGHASAGYYTDLSEYIDILDFENNDSKWGSVYARELGMVQGVQYGLTPYSWPEARPAVASILAVNEGLVKRFGKEDPREMLEKREWNWDNFVTYIEDCTFLDDIQYYGFGGNNLRDVFSGAFLSNGCEIVNIDSDGNITVGLETPQGLEAINWVMSLANEHLHCFYKEKKTLAVPDDVAIDYFLGNETFVWHTTSSVYTQYVAYGMEDAAFMPFPIGPQGEYGKWAGFTYGSNKFGIYADADKPEYAAITINEICKPLEGIKDDNALLDYYTKNVFFDERDAKIFLDINENARYTMNYYPVSGHEIWNRMGTTKKSAAEFVQSEISAYMEIVEKHMVPNAKYINELLDKKE